ncbi:MAG: polysaccharide biosynthesis protein [Caldisericaceae bacterium]
MRKLFEKILRNKLTITITFAKLIIDVFLYNVATVLSILLRFDFILKTNFIHIDDLPGIVENIVFIAFEIIFQLPLHSFEFTSVKEISDILVAVFLTKAVSYPIFYLLRKNISFSRGAYLASFMIAFLLIAGVRILYRLLYEFRNTKSAALSKRKKNVLIIGAGDAGEKLLREILSHPQLNYNVVGFLDDDPSRKRLRIHGFQVLGSVARLPYIIKEYGVDVVIYAIPSAPREHLQKVVALASSSTAEIKTLPAIWEIVSGRVRIEDIKNVELEDLLSRASIKMDNSIVENYIKGKTVLITGAGGSIGSEIARQVVNFKPKKVILLGRGENRIFDIEIDLLEKKHFYEVVPVICDIRNREKVFKVFETYKPEIVFHAAAHKHVPLMEKNPDEAILNNVFGTKNLLDASLKFKVERFINISTDKAVNPINIMGASKKITEMLLQYYANNGSKTKFASVRFGNVLGSKGSVLEVFKKQMKETGVLTITDPQMERYFMLIPEAVQLVLQSASMGENGEIFVLKMGEPVNILNFAKHFVKLSGFEVGKDIHIKIIGNRGGEKIKEELWSEKENVLKTQNPYILKVVSNENLLDKEDFFAKLGKLENAALSFNVEEINSVLKEIIPEYKD